ncbi:MAG: LuxR C-terminal-related transcriptional regulator [Bacteroidia bacterium]|jgi:DNA-binding CsgD family transcriptional regulator|nr:LuxR C-terminal-related transcriptional regulator [Bacteroidia bacterium]
MTNTVTIFKQYCAAKIASRCNDVSVEHKKQLVDELKNSPLRQVVQAWSVLDFYTYTHLHAEGYERYFGWPDAEMTSEKILEIVHPDDQEAFAKLYYLVLEGLLAMPVPVKSIGHFCISYRIQTAQGNYVRVLETNNIIESDESTNTPLICLSQMSRIDFGTPNEKVYYYFVITDKDGSVEIMSEYLKQYNPVVNVFSENELKIVRLMMQGKTSQEIADTIFLSKHTIDKYRKNLLEKTGSANSASLILHMQSVGVV